MTHTDAHAKALEAAYAETIAEFDKRGWLDINPREAVELYQHNLRRALAGEREQVVERMAEAMYSGPNQIVPWDKAIDATQQWFREAGEKALTASGLLPGEDGK